jgi:hypothetical protein
MASKYKVLKIKDDHVLDTEPIGSKSKFWVNIDVDGKAQDWLFKIPRKNTGEHWAEKVAAEIAALLEIPHADVELAQFRDEKGSCSKSFISAEKRPELIHGNEILAGRVIGYKKDKKYGQSEHTYKNIKEAIRRTGSESESQRALKHFAGYLVLDGLIANTDRHHENWAYLKWTDNKKQTHQVLAPTFDHASSLGRELTDSKRKMYIKQDRVKWYINRGKGAIFENINDKKGLNPFKLVEFGYKQNPSIFKPWLAAIKKVNPDSFRNILMSVPDNFINDSERSFALKMLQINLQKLTAL